ncbi:metalloproteinase inhibitor 3-like [Labeo rohita]|uniref:metalloproteinase inhibitor 3-like n=1 Tax=Labeo rohita TaxID=84645 RepID=UPI0021E343D8|nr:metalloproteinase inhibitor 3-like [Labeo rohita]
MGVPLSAAVTLGLMFFLSVGLNEQVAEGCVCTARHPQQMFCNSDIVIRAKITGKVTNTQPDLTAYGVRIIKTFKYVNKKPFQVIYSHKTSCHIDLENKEYLLSGKIINYLKSDFETLNPDAGCEHLLRLEYTTQIMPRF